jgi:TonB family protein
MTSNPFAILFALLLTVSASTSDARQAAAESDAGAEFAAEAESLRRDAERAFAEERWSEAAAAYGHFVEHLLEGGYAPASDAVAAYRLKSAIACRNGGDDAGALTMLTQLVEAAPEYEAARTQVLLAEVRAALEPPPAPPAVAADARQPVVEEAGDTAEFTAVAENLRREAEMAFAEGRWSEAAPAYGRLVAHLVEGGYAPASDAIAGIRLRIADAFKRNGDHASAQTMLVHLAQDAPGYETARTQALLHEVRAALGQLASPPEPSPVEEPRVRGPIRMGGDVTRPEKVSGPGAEYTRDARRARIQGVVILEVIIDENGNVTNVKVLKPLPMGLDHQAVEAVERWKFRPATLHGRPVAVYYNLTVNFRLQ